MPVILGRAARCRAPAWLLTALQVRSVGLAVALLVWLLLLGAMAPPARADAVQSLRDFAAQARSGRASFAQTVTSPDGARRRQSSGSFEFQRPNKFRFSYDRPNEQLIVSDGARLWLYDPGLNQATSRRLAQALSSSPAALLAGADLDREFELQAEATRDGVQWALARPRAGDGSVQSVRVGFKQGQLWALEITDAFGQRSLLQFDGLALNVPIGAERFRFAAPAGTDVIEQ